MTSYAVTYLGFCSFYPQISLELLHPYPSPHPVHSTGLTPQWALAGSSQGLDGCCRQDLPPGAQADFLPFGFSSSYEPGEMAGSLLPSLTNMVWAGSRNPPYQVLSPT